MIRAPFLALLGVLCYLPLGCSSPEESMASEVLPTARNQSIMACGERLYVGAPVVLWTEPNGYSAYETGLHFAPPSSSTRTPARGELRYEPGRRNRQTGEVLVAAGSTQMVALQRALDMFVLHYDLCGVSQTCFKVLHDRRGLSVHFMIDVDGTIYQTLDLRDTAWHARQTNGRSVGVEIAQIGAYPLNSDGDKTLEDWYEQGPEETRLTLPKDPMDLGVLTPGFVGSAARPGKQIGSIQGQRLQQYDFTPEQYDSLVKLTEALCRNFPLIEPDAPRDAMGQVARSRIPEAEELAFQGIVGHYHVSSQKTDPGPAFDWEGYLARVRTRLLR